MFATSCFPRGPLGPRIAARATSNNTATQNNVARSGSNGGGIGGAAKDSNGGAAKDSIDKELQLRAAAMANLQQQLARVESLRAEELKTAISRFEELEEALSMAERTILDLERENQAIKAAARQELVESQSLVQKAMQVIEAMNDSAVAFDDESFGDEASADESPDASETSTSASETSADAIIEELEAELGQLHDIIAGLSPSSVDARIEFEVPEMLSVSELEHAVGRLTESQRRLAAAEKENATLRAKVEALERAEREATVVVPGAGKNREKVYVRDLEARNRELARMLGGSEAGLEEGAKLLRRVLERFESNGETT